MKLLIHYLPAAQWLNNSDLAYWISFQHVTHLCPFTIGNAAKLMRCIVEQSVVTNLTLIKISQN